jgi:hypothetical protein
MLGDLYNEKIKLTEERFNDRLTECLWCQAYEDIVYATEGFPVKWVEEPKEWTEEEIVKRLLDDTGGDLIDNFLSTYLYSLEMNRSRENYGEEPFEHFDTYFAETLLYSYDWGISLDTDELTEFCSKWSESVGVLETVKMIMMEILITKTHREKLNEILNKHTTPLEAVVTISRLLRAA